MTLDCSDVTVTITESDYYRLPDRIKRLVQNYAADNPFLIPKKGKLTVTMSRYRWDEICEEMKVIQGK